MPRDHHLPLIHPRLYGIDKSGESVEIAKLSLWLKTAEYGRRLTFLDRNIRQGNSVVSDDMLDPWAFDWQSGQVVRSFLEPEVEAGPDRAGHPAERPVDGARHEATRSLQRPRAVGDGAVHVLDDRRHRLRRLDRERGGPAQVRHALA